MRLVKYCIFGLLLSVGHLSLASQCETAQTECWSPCDGDWVQVRGEVCDTLWNPAGKCWDVKGTCKAGGEPYQGACTGETKTCWNPCGGSWVRHDNADSCEVEWQRTDRCWENQGYCSKE